MFASSPTELTGVIVFRDEKTNIENNARNDALWHFGSQTTAMTHFGSDTSWSGEVYDDFGMNDRPKTVEGGVIKTNTTQIYLIQNDGSNWNTFVDGKQQLSGASGGINKFLFKSKYLSKLNRFFYLFFLLYSIFQKKKWNRIINSLIINN